MNTSSNKLLRKIYVTSFDIFKFLHYKPKHYYYDASLPIFHMYGLIKKQVFLRLLCNSSVTIPKALTLFSCNYMERMANSTAKQPFGEASMEPYVETYYNSTNNHEIPFTFPSEHMECENNTQRLNNELGVCDEPVLLRNKYLEDHHRYKKMRFWQLANKEKLASKSEEYFIVRVLSFNILAQYLMESYPFLYKTHDQQALFWEKRRQLLFEEILEAKANIICIQEMQEDHLEDFLVPFKRNGYSFLFKKRTNDKRDGLLVLYRSDHFVLLDYAKVEFYQSGIELLNRDNVGIIAKLAVKENPEIQLVVATTHLLYNRKRNDVRLGQTQLLLAEIERIAFVESTPMGAKYLPVILTGDFNLEPYSGVYEFITKGCFEYQGKGKTLEPTEYRSLSNSLIPPRLLVTDNCQHYNILKHRLCGKGLCKVMLENSESPNTEKDSSAASSSTSEVNTDTTDHQIIRIVHDYNVNFCSGTLTHPFHFNSVYKHKKRNGRREATTFQNDWITVDYIFYTDIELIERYRLPIVDECVTFPTIPNCAVGSDHLCLAASFKVYKNRRINQAML